MSKICVDCFCCGYHLVPRYKRLVNNIFSQNPQHGLDKNNLEALRFYAVLKPEKLDKSFRYMSEKIARYIRQRNRPYVILGIKAMNDTMKSCYQQLNTFVDYYLATLHLVLEETDDLELIEHAINSFESFCEIREEAPNQQRNYQFFVDRFTQLCHYTPDQNQLKFRSLGLRGHHAFIRKTANDELQNDAWRYMDQIVPSILLNMQIREEGQPSTMVPDENDPTNLAEMILKDLVFRAHSNNISACTQPILGHFDNHAKWIPVDFPKYVFALVMNSIRHHNTYVIIDLLLNHLEKYFEHDDVTNIKTSIMNVIHQCLVLAATNTGAGSTMFAGISSLLKFLRKSFQIELNRSNNTHHERQFQTAVIDGIKDFTEKLPDFQMMEIFQYILTSFPILNKYQQDDSRLYPISVFREANVRFQYLLLQTIHQIMLRKRSKQSADARERSEENYQSTTFPHQLFDPLLKLLTTSESEIRLIVLEILQVFIDRRHNTEKLRKIRIPKDISQLDLSIETKPTHAFDISFMKKFGRQFLSQLSRCILMINNTKEIFYAIYSLINIVTFEANDQDTLVDFIHFSLKIQSETIQSIPTVYYCIHALIAAYLNLMSKLYRIADFSDHVDQIIHAREDHASHLLPPNAFRYLSSTDSNRTIPDDCLFSEEIIIQALHAANYDISRFHRIIVNDEELDSPIGNDPDETETEESISSKTDLHVENSNDEISYQTIRKVLQPTDSTRRVEEENQRFVKDFRTKPFEELKSRVHQRQTQSNQRLEQLLNVRYLPHDRMPIVISNEHLPSTDGTTSFNYPDLFTY